jgi:hypothetical protein
MATFFATKSLACMPIPNVLTLMPAEIGMSFLPSSALDAAHNDAKAIEIDTAVTNPAKTRFFDMALSS